MFISIFTFIYTSTFVLIMSLNNFHFKIVLQNILDTFLKEYLKGGLKNVYFFRSLKWE